LLGDAIDRTLAERVVGQANRHIRRPVKLDDIQRAVSDFFGVEPKALRSDDRHKSVSQPRMLAMWLARKYTQSAWREIGSYFGGRSHSTVISAHRRVEKQLSRAESANLAGHPWPLHEAIERIEAVLRTG
jgi:chromosomal replication initiator protein